MTLAGPSMRPAPVAAGFQLWGPGNVSRASNSGAWADAAGERLSTMPLDVANFTMLRREIRIFSHLFVMPPSARHRDEPDARGIRVPPRERKQAF